MKTALAYLAKLVNNSNFTMVYGRYNELGTATSQWGETKPTYIWGHHIIIIVIVLFVRSTMGLSLTNSPILHIHVMTSVLKGEVRNATHTHSLRLCC